MKTQQACQAYVDKWDFTTQQTAMTANARTIAQTLEQADPIAFRVWIGYYNVAGTGGAVLSAPKVCQTPFANALTKLNGALKAAISGTGTFWVDSDSILGGRSNLLQTLHVSDLPEHTVGWPHPNSRGHTALATYVLRIKKTTLGN